MLNGILNYEEVHKNLRNKLVNIQTPASNQSAKNSNVSDNRVLDDILVEVVWDPIWNQNMMSEEAKTKLGM